eukprot:scaffold18.g2032.t1
MASSNATTVLASVDDLLGDVDIAQVVRQMLTDPDQALAGLADLLASAFPSLAGLLPNTTSTGTKPAGSGKLDLAALQPILKAIAADPAAAAQLPTLLPLFQALSTRDTSKLASIDYTALQPVLSAIWNDPAARASIPLLLPALTKAAGSAVSDATGSDALGGLLAGIGDLAAPLLDAVFNFGTAPASATKAAPL